MCGRSASCLKALLTGAPRDTFPKPSTCREDLPRLEQQSLLRRFHAAWAFGQLVDGVLLGMSTHISDADKMNKYAKKHTDTHRDMSGHPPTLVMFSVATITDSSQVNGTAFLFPMTLVPKPSLT